MDPLCCGMNCVRHDLRSHREPIESRVDKTTVAKLASFAREVDEATAGGLRFTLKSIGEITVTPTPAPAVPAAPVTRRSRRKSLPERSPAPSAMIAGDPQAFVWFPLQTRLREKFGGGQVQCPGDSDDAQYGHIRFASLDPAHIAAIDLDVESQFLLREAAGDSHALNCLAQGDECGISPMAA